jgi:uncharacterized membrane protein
MMSTEPAEQKSPEPQPATDAAKHKRRQTSTLASIRSRIMAGVLFIIPLAVTVWLLTNVYNLALAVGVRLINWFSKGVLWAINRAIEAPAGPSPSGGTNWSQHWVAALSEAAKNPPKIDPSTAYWYQNLLAVVLTILLLYFLGRLGTNVAGRRFIGLLDFLAERIPLADTIYPAVKRMVQALSGKPGERGQRVVLVGFPNNEMRTIGFETNRVKDSNSGEEFVTIFIPTPPTPTSGYMVIVRQDQITQTNWTMEEALSMILSGGATARPQVQFFPPGTVHNPSDAIPRPNR